MLQVISGLFVLHYYTVVDTWLQLLFYQLYTAVSSALIPAVEMNTIDTLLPHLRDHLPMLFKSTILFFAIQSASYTLSPVVFPKTMRGMSQKERIEWSSKTVGEY